MASKRPGQPKSPAKGSSLVLGLLLAVLGAGLAVVVGGVAFFLILRDRPEPPPAPPVAQGDDSKPPPPPQPGPPRLEPWWDGIPDSSLAATATFLKEAVTQEQALFDNLGSKKSPVRVAAYQKLLAKLPEMIRNPKAKMLLESFVVECYAQEPDDKNAASLRGWLVNEIPKENTAFPPTYKSENLDRSFWAVKVGIDTVTDKKLQPNRAEPLSQAVGKALAFAIVPGKSPRAELQIKMEKLLVLRCYRNLIPTAQASLPDALTIRTMLLSKAADILSPASRLQVDLEIVKQGAANAKTAWPAYSALLKDCLEAKDMNTDLAILAIYGKADPDFAAKMDSVMADRFSEAYKDARLDRKGRMAAVRRVLGVPEPIDRPTQLDKLVKDALAKTDSPTAKPNAVLQETVRLTHASTLACALMKKGTGIDRFDELVALIPELDPDAPPPTVAKEDKTQKPEPKKGGEPVAGKGPIVIRGVLRSGINNPHAVSLKRGRTYSIYMGSDAFDAYLRLNNSRGITLAQDDDGGGNLNALIHFTPPIDDRYTVVATSFGGRGAGPYTITVDEIKGFVPPVGGFMFPGRPFGPFGRPFPGRFPPPRFGPPPPMIFPGQPMVNPQQPKDKDPGKVKPAATDDGSQIDEADLKALTASTPKPRVAAFLAITAKLKGSLSQKDLTPLQATKIARFLVSRESAELDELVPELPPLGKSRNLMLALADAIESEVAKKKDTTETVVGTLLDQPLLFGNDAWKPACRKLVLLHAMEMSARSNAATDAADFLRELYQEQGVLLGMDAKAFEKLTKPSTVMEAVIKHLAAQLEKSKTAKEDKDYLDQIPRHLAAAQFVARNDLEHTVLLQRVWIKVLAIHLEQQNPSRAQELRQISTDLSDADRGWTSILEQLRGGEEKILRAWTMALH